MIAILVIQLRASGALKGNLHNDANRRKDRYDLRPYLGQHLRTEMDGPQIRILADDGREWIPPHDGEMGRREKVLDAALWADFEAFRTVVEIHNRRREENEGLREKTTSWSLVETEQGVWVRPDAGEQ